MKILIFFSALLFSLNLFAMPAHRIITLAPNLTEIVFAAGAGKYLVGVSGSSDYPKSALKIPIVASFQRVDLEKLITLQPDLIITWQYTNALMVSQLNRLHMPVYKASSNQLSDIPKTIEAIGKLAGTEKIAKKSAKSFRVQLKALRRKYSQRKPIAVFYQLSQTPLMTLNKNSLVDGVIKLCGGKNIFENTPGVSPTISIENVLQRNPQVILVSDFSGNKNAVQFWQKYPMLQAVKNKRIYFVNPSLVERYGPRILQGAASICRDVNS